MNLKRYYELADREIQTITTGKAKAGQKQERDQAKELHELLRSYTYQLIGLGNCFRRIARDFSGLDGSNWRNNRHLSGRVNELAKELYSTNPYDTDAILKIENELLAIAEKLSHAKAS